MIPSGCSNCHGDPGHHSQLCWDGQMDKKQRTIVALEDKLKVMEAALGKADDLLKSAKAFDSEVHCYSAGVSVLLEEDMVPRHEDLMRSIKAYEQSRKQQEKSSGKKFEATINDSLNTPSWEVWERHKDSGNQFYAQFFGPDARRYAIEHAERLNGMERKK